MTSESSPEPGDATQVHVRTATSRLPGLDVSSAEVRRLFLLFYTVTDDLCVRRGPAGVVVDLALVDAVRHYLAEVTATGDCPAATITPCRLFGDFWRALTKLVPVRERDQLVPSLRGMAASMGVKYRCIASSERLGLDEFLAVRRRVPGMSFLELERVLRSIPPGAAPVAATEAVADCLSWTNDLHSVDKEEDEGFNLVLVLRDAHQLTKAEAVTEAETFLYAGHTRYLRAKAGLGAAPGSPAARLLAVYDDVVAAVALLHAESPRYTRPISTSDSPAPPR